MYRSGLFASHLTRDVARPLLSPARACGATTGSLVPSRHPAPGPPPPQSTRRCAASRSPTCGWAAAPVKGSESEGKQAPERTFASLRPPCPLLAPLPPLPPAPASAAARTSGPSCTRMARRRGATGTPSAPPLAPRRRPPRPQRSRRASSGPPRETRGRPLRRQRSRRHPPSHCSGRSASGGRRGRSSPWRCSEPRPQARRATSRFARARHRPSRQRRSGRCRRCCRCRSRSRRAWLLASRQEARTPMTHRSCRNSGGKRRGISGRRAGAAPFPARGTSRLPLSPAHLPLALKWSRPLPEWLK